MHTINKYHYQQISFHPFHFLVTKEVIYDMRRLNYFKILSDKKIKVVGFHGLKRFFYAYVSYDGNGVMISNIATKNIPYICVHMPDTGVIKDREFYHMLQSKNAFGVLYEFAEFYEVFVPTQKRIKQDENGIIYILD